MVVWKNKRPDLLPEDFLKKRELTMMKHFLLWLDILQSKPSLHQIDVKTSFLNCIIEEEAYIEQPEGFIVHEKDSHVCKLKKELYGLKQAPRALVWTDRQIPSKTGIHQE